MTSNSMMTVEQVNSLIRAGHRMMVAGEEKLLLKLAKGDWIGGTIPYFMSEGGGATTREEVQATVLPKLATNSRIRFYTKDDFHTLPSHYPKNGFSLIVVPAFSTVHHQFAKEGGTWKGIFERPLVGWVSGIHLDDLGKNTPKVINGQTGELSNAKAVVMHLDLPDNVYASTNIINLFEPGHGDTITFPETGFEVGECQVNGKTMNFSEYLSNNKIDQRLPLVADYFGAKINVSFQANDTAKKLVQLYAPVFNGVEYRIAKPLDNYESQFVDRLRTLDINPVFTCNCILNFLYAELEGKKTGHLVGPITFGEIAYMLLNQTLVYLTIEKRKN